ncbi:MAG: hypothetical protein ACYC9Y_12580 [Candidatus Methylomirabilia bacterium]
MGDTEQDPRTECYCYEDLCLRVTSDEPSQLTWLRETLAPHFRPAAARVPDVEVRLVADADRYRRRGSLAETGRSLPAFALDSEIVNLPVLDGPSGTLVLANSRHRVVYEVREDRSAVCIVSEPGDVQARSGILPVVREFAMNEAAARGDFFLHASCFVSGGRPVVVAGPRNSGKTTLVAFACLFAGADFLVNDRLRVSMRQGRCTLGGVPTIITIRPMTLEFFPALGRGIREGGLHANLTTAEQLDQALPRPALFARGRYRLSPLQFRRLLGTEQVATAVDPVVVIPRITGRPGSFALRRLDADEAFELLQDSFFGARHWAISTPVFNRHPGRAALARPQWEERWREFSSTRPCLLCEIGEDLYAHRENAAAWVSAVTTDSA